ncbi:MAG: helix-turn-helix transcriptional regulator [Pseudomonadota bacterium]
MLNHRRIWRAIDKLALRHGLSSSALAKQAGLDPTAFNKSKRMARDGRERWPSTESIAKILHATGESVDTFMAFLADTDVDTYRRPIPLLGLAQAGAGGYFDDGGFPVGTGWEEIRFPSKEYENTYALEISGDSMTPVYRDGDIIIVAPGEDVRRGDRVVVRTVDGEVMAKILKRQTATTVEVASFNVSHEDRLLQLRDVEWMARIIWASQ